MISAGAPGDAPAAAEPRFASFEAPAQAMLWSPSAGPTAEPAALTAPIVDTSALVQNVLVVQKQATQLVAERVAAAAAAAAEAERKAAAVKAATAGCAGLPTGGLGAVLPHVRTAAQFLGCRFGKPTMYGVSGRGGVSDHPSGKAVDFMVDTATGNQLADCALQNMKALGISYVIWRQRINFGSGWQAMEDRGSVTENHYDHVHVSFNNSAGGTPKGC
ncbi:hypothetical protein [Pseudonocardia sp. GCM10023141]|uniref:hypothetical protein n=1 Tax=Pseudonocardia sp. GCM10023141 TaxID=3252653 RepID=UPI00361B735E